MHGKQFFAGGVFISLGVLSVRERTGGELAWEEWR